MGSMNRRAKGLILTCTLILVLKYHVINVVSASRSELAFATGRSRRGSYPCCRLRKTCVAASVGTVETNLDIPTVEVDAPVSDVRPHEQRATRPRTARRLNHAFRYLYRHENVNETCIDDLSSLDFLIQYGGYTEDQVYEMNRTFPPLLDLSVQRHLRPKMRFLQETLCGLESNQIETLTEKVRQVIPPQYFGARLERTIAPRHAFLVYNNLPHGRELLEESGHGNTLWQDFLMSCRRTKQFCALCNTWKQKYGDRGNPTTRITAKQVEAFDVLFGRGLMAAARDELCQSHNAWPLQHVNITSGELISLLMQHGANPLERDVRGVSLLHWAAGSGNLGALEPLLPLFSDGVFTEAERDGATILHWAATGAKAREFGCGGHINVCRFLLEQVQGRETKKLVNTVTKDGNSVLHWAAWSGTLDVVKLLIRNRADPSVANRNGCTVAHWAASGGNLEVCRYLAETVKVDFTEPNYGGNTPLTHAVAFGRVEVVDWLRNEICEVHEDDIAAELAKDFVGWNGGDERRKEVLNLFHDWFGYDNNGATMPVANEDDDLDYY